MGGQSSSTRVQPILQGILGRPSRFDENNPDIAAQSSAVKARDEGNS